VARIAAMAVRKVETAWPAAARSAIQLATSTGFADNSALP
jgi:hypothetical protein